MKAKPDEYSDKEAARRAEEAIRRSFAMPPKPQRKLVGKTPGARGIAQRRRRAKTAPKA